MKGLFRNSTSLVLVITTVFMTISCENESAEEISPQVTKLTESKLISFDKIEKMTARGIPGEMLHRGQKVTGVASEKQTGRLYSGEGATYYFYGTVNDGDHAETNLNGELNFDITYYGDVFKALRGTYVSGNGEVSQARGAILADYTVYLILELPDNTLLRGIGYANPDNGGIIGNFDMYTTDSTKSTGTWLANVKEILTPKETIVDILASDSRFTELVSALEETEISATLKSDAPYTVFAPTNNAFDMIGILPDGDALRDLLLHHVVEGKFDTRAIHNRMIFSPLFGEDITIGFNSTLFTVNDTVQIIHSNVETANGYIHVIDAVLIK
ncbi:fasciclin domain-containing protein [Aquimarina aquimarini]|uniref:fasciclin domain-containing protein n=1 Tax=Aquimarina aquimarini TaxID=1191734 RepID=UPI000D562AA2|nr:fasciclin domain-containing protein [Aquimarina aquimarini]